MEIEQILKIYVAEAMPRITKCVFDEQRAQIRREKLMENLMNLYKARLPRDGEQSNHQDLCQPTSGPLP
ncbi:hypothetical protein UFOVP25_9 [uncultured Caudovirales phage]|uniref:Uncharacterized protein n=1 Tax=uncultured Caudovirales phage TaxID=2100421 RepID=A0A6J5KKQ8_9CAUD|nr:hypothetical protein UFOVP25_9 [uncultured Caudovirales phage]